MDYSKWKKTREGALSKLVQQVTKNGEKETESEAVKGETLEQILEGWEAGDSHTEASEQWERFKKQINLNWRVNRAVESGPCKLAIEVLNTSKVLIIPSRCSWLQMQELAHTAGIPCARLQGSGCQGVCLWVPGTGNLCPVSGRSPATILSCLRCVAQSPLPKSLQNMQIPLSTHPTPAVQNQGVF